MYYKNIISEEKIIIISEIEDFSKFENIENVLLDVCIDCINVTDLSFLKNIKSIGRNLMITNCKNLKSSNGLESILNIKKDVYITGNPLLKTLNFNNGLEIGGKLIIDQSILENLKTSKFKNILEIYDYHKHFGVGKVIKSLEPTVPFGKFVDGTIISFVNVDETFENYKNLKFNIIVKDATFDGVDNFEFLETLTSVRNLKIKNSNIENLDFLNNLEFVENLEILNCPKLLNIKGISKLNLYTCICIK